VTQVANVVPAVAVLTADQIKGLVREALREHASAQSAPTAPTQPARRSVREAAQALGCCVRHVHRLCAIGSLKRTKIGSRVYVTQASIDKLLQESTR
jgi:Helix-turn-helix domain